MWFKPMNSFFFSSCTALLIRKFPSSFFYATAMLKGIDWCWCMYFICENGEVETKKGGNPVYFRIHKVRKRGDFGGKTFVFLLPLQNQRVIRMKRSENMLHPNTEISHKIRSTFDNMLELNKWQLLIIINVTFFQNFFDDSCNFCTAQSISS